MLGLALPGAVIMATWSLGNAMADPKAWPAMDLDIMRELGHRWMDTGSMYLTYQLAGPFSVNVQIPLGTTPGLYPPAAGPLFAALSMIPWPIAVVAWYAIPAAILGYALWRWRPHPLAWAGMVAMGCFAMTWLVLYAGGTTMWASALVAAGFLWGWPAALILVKPILLPFALVGARRRSWWIVAGIVALLTLLGPWQDYITVARNASDVSYVVVHIPLMLVPVIAYLGRARVVGRRVDVVGPRGRGEPGRVADVVVAH